MKLFTVKVIFTVFTINPLTARTVMVWLPDGVDDPVLIVRELVVDGLATEAGLKETVTPDGSAELTERSTVPIKPAKRVSVTVLLAGDPAFTVPPEVALILKSGLIKTFTVSE